ncbi:PREDICTED: sorbitol dehydrogenase-like isoform X2 [Habropoda laboriosa]|uniref:sorbitol dehydrogenase-like isoform X2 n=1 Tax=Habropoda laboriosa TaxID=597456 RepID=UPI00083E52C0|nr:PREDICTED: sorbitol dehydrogenase-like isoform X2 [Habropoda laboriosa]
MDTNISPSFQNESNLTAILYGINDIRLVKTPIEEPDQNEVLMEMGCVGICGSDVHYLVNGRIGDFVVREPMIIGHESSGVVVKLGKNVKNLKVGDRVAIEPGVSCRVCKFCKEGRYNLCKEIVFCATPPVHGNLRRFYKHAADFCFKLPDYVTLAEGALLEPLSVGVHACKRANISIGSKVLILGAGPIGLLSLLVAKTMGASQIVITDLLQSRLNLAKKLGADETLLLRKEDPEPAVVQRIHKLFGDEPDKTIDACGAQSTIRLAIYATKAGGVAVLVGMGPPEVKIPLITALVKEVDIRGVFRYANDYADALDLLATRKIDVKPLITHNYKMEDTVQAFETAKSGQSDVVKVMIHCNASDQKKSSFS